MKTEFDAVLGGEVRSSLDLQTENPVYWTLYNKNDTAVSCIKFQDGAPTEAGPNGFTIEDLLQVCHERIDHLNEYLPSDENAEAMDHIRQAIELLGRRYKRRLAETASE